MLKEYLLRGVKAGVVAGVSYGLFVALIGNPLIGYAETFEAGHHEAASSSPEAVTGLLSMVGGTLFGILLGAVVLGVGFYFLEPAIPGTRGTKSYLLAAAGFITISGAPWLVLPPQPPGVDQALSTGPRIGLYGAMMVIGAVCCGLAGYVYIRLRGRHHIVVAACSALMPFVLLPVAVAVAPENSTSGPIPDRLAYLFRMITVFGQVGLWVVLASAHAWFLTNRRDDSTCGTDMSMAKRPGSSTPDP